MKTFKFFQVLLVLFFLPVLCASQTNGTLLIVADKDCDLVIDGGNNKKLMASQPLKIDLSEGEHYIQCSLLDKSEKNMVVTIEPTKQKVVKLQFSELASSQSNATSTEKKKLEPISVANLNFTIPGQVLNILTTSSGEEKGVELPTFFYAFDEGDEVYMDCNIENEKGGIILEVKTEPENLTVYSNRDFKKISNEKFKVNKRGIYKFIFSTNHGWDRKCRFSIRRLPTDESKINFNTTAIKKKKFKTVAVQEPSTYFINSTNNETFKGGKSRISIPVTLPKNTVEWYYIVSSTRNEDEIKGTTKQFHLLGDLNKAISGINPTSTVLNLAMNLITQPPGADYCNVYLLDYTNLGYFSNKQKFSFILQGSRENVTSGVVKVNCCNSGQIYLAMQNPDTWYGIHLGIEIVAIVTEEGYNLD